MSKTYFLIKLQKKQKKRKPDFTIISHNIGGQSAIWEKNPEYKYYLANDRGTFDGNFENWNKTDKDKLTTHLNKFKQNNTFFLLQEFRNQKFEKINKTSYPTDASTKPDLHEYTSYELNITPIEKYQENGIVKLTYYDLNMKKKRHFFPINSKDDFRNTVINEIFYTKKNRDYKFGFNNTNYYDTNKEQIIKYLDRLKIYNFNKENFYLINIHGIIINENSNVLKLFKHLLIFETILKFLEKFDNVIIGGDFNIELNKIFNSETNSLDDNFKNVIRSIYQTFFSHLKILNNFTNNNFESNATLYIDYHENQLKKIFENCSFQNKDTYNINNFTNAWTLNHEDETQYPNGHEEGIKKNVDYILVSNKLKEKYDLKWTIDTSMVYTKEEQIKKVDVEPYVNDFDHAVVKLEMFKK